jgi:hypothetical protein
MEEEAPPCGLVLQTPAPVRMNMERKLTLSERQGATVVKQPVNAREKIEDMIRFSRLLNTAHIDKKKLWQKVEQVLEHKKTATLLEVITEKGLDNGVAEVISYFSFLREKASQVQYMQEITELIPLDAEKTNYLEIPYLLFARKN